MSGGDGAIAQESGFQEQRSCFSHDVAEARLNGIGLTEEFQRARRIGLKFGGVSQCKVGQIPFQSLRLLEAFGFAKQSYGFSAVSNRATGIAVVRECARNRRGISPFPSDGMTGILQSAERFVGAPVAQEGVAAMFKER